MTRWFLFVVGLATLGLASALGAPVTPPEPAPDCPKEVASPQSKPGDWETLFAKESWYKDAKEKERVFSGKLKAVPGAGGPGILMRTSYYRLRDRTVYTGGKKVKALDRLIGKEVEIRGKPVNMELEGQALAEIWPAAVRPTPEKPVPVEKDKP